MMTFKKYYYIILTLFSFNLANAIVFLNTTDATQITDEEIFENNVGLNQKIHEHIQNSLKLSEQELDATINSNDSNGNNIESASVPNRPGDAFTKSSHINKSDTYPEKYILYLGEDFKLIEYNLGVLSSLDSSKLDIQGIVGSGWGALVGGLWSLGYSITEIRNELKLLTNSAYNKKEELPFKNTGLGYRNTYHLNFNGDEPHPSKYVQVNREIEFDFYISKWFDRNHSDTYKLPVYIVTGSIEKPYLKIDSNEISTTLRNSFIDINELRKKHHKVQFGIQYFKQELNPLLIEYFKEFKLIKTDYIEAMKNQEHIEETTALETLKNLNSAKLGNYSKNIVSLLLHLNDTLEPEEEFEQGRNHFLNRTISLVNKKNTDSLNTNSPRSKQKAFLAHEYVIFLGLELNEVASVHRALVQSYFPNGSNNPIPYDQLLESIQLLKSHPFYSKAIVKFEYRADQNGYVLSIDIDPKTLNQIQIKMAGAYQIGPGVLLETQHYWVSQFLNQIQLNTFVSPILRRANAVLFSEFGNEMEWGMGFDLSYEQWLLNEKIHHPELKSIELSELAYIARYKLKQGFSSSHSIKFVNSNFLTKTSQVTYKDALEGENSFFVSPWIEFKGLEVLNSLEWHPLKVGVDFRTDAYQGLGQFENPLLVEPHFQLKYNFLFYKNLEFTPMIQARGSYKYLSLLKKRFEFKEPVSSEFYNSIDPLIDTLLNTKIDIGELSSYTWDTRYFSDQYIAIELPLWLHYQDISLGVNVFHITYYDNDPELFSRKWLAFETLVKYSTSEIEWVLGLENSKYDNWREEFDSFSRKWVFRVGIWSN